MLLLLLRTFKRIDIYYYFTPVYLYTAIIILLYYYHLKLRLIRLNIILQKSLLFFKMAVLFSLKYFLKISRNLF